MVVPFEANSGQFDERVAFMGKTFAGAVFVTRQGQIVYSLPGPKTDGDATRQPGWSLSETLLGAQPLSPVGGELAPTRISRFSGPHSYQAATYRNVHLGQAWPGIAVELAARASNVEKLFHLAPHADARQIQVQVHGAQALRVGEGGTLIATTAHGEVAYTAPVAFQQSGGKRVDVPVQYALNATGDGYGFALGTYDPALPLVIDPLLQSTYLGGSGDDHVKAMAIDETTGEVLLAGWVTTPPLATWPGAVHGPSGGGNYGFVARLSSNLRTLVQMAYLGDGAKDTEFQAIAIDTQTRDVIVAGETYSERFPVTAGVLQPQFGGIRDAVVARLSSDLQQLHGSTYLGEKEHDWINALAIDPITDEIVVAGGTMSVRFPVTAQGWQQTHGDGGPTGYDGFVARLSSDLTRLEQSTFLGGNGFDQITALSIDAHTRDLVVAGFAEARDFPTTTDAAQTTHAGGFYDGFVARLSLDLSTLRHSTFLGGSETDTIAALAMDKQTGDVLVGGNTDSANFPGISGGALTDPDLISFNDNGFVTRLSGDLATLRQSTYLGTAHSNDGVNALLLDPDTGDVLAGGQTTSSSFPKTQGGAQPDKNGSTYELRGMVARLSGDLTWLEQSTYLGGKDGGEYVHALALDKHTGQLLVAGYSSSTDFPQVAGAIQAQHAGRYDGFVARLTADLLAVSVQTINFPQQSDQTFTTGGSFAIDPLATANSGLPVVYRSDTPAVCTVSGTTVSMVSAGTCMLVASQPGNAQWEPAPPESVDIRIGQGQRQRQTIKFPRQRDQVYAVGGSFPIHPEARANSKEPVSYRSRTPRVCRVSDATPTSPPTVYIVSTGTCWLVAFRGGDTAWLPADTVYASLRIRQAPQTIDFPAQSDQVYAPGGSFAIAPPATASSKLQVDYHSHTPDVCTVSGGSVSMHSPGLCTLQAHQPGDDLWLPADRKEQHVVLSAPVGPGPGPGTAVPVPTLGPIAMGLMGLLTAAMGTGFLRRRSRPRSRVTTAT